MSHPPLVSRVQVHPLDVCCWGNWNVNKSDLTLKTLCRSHLIFPLGASAGKPKADGPAGSFFSLWCLQIWHAAWAGRSPFRMTRDEVPQTSHWNGGGTHLPQHDACSSPGPSFVNWVSQYKFRDTATGVPSLHPLCTPATSATPCRMTHEDGLWASWAVLQLLVLTEPAGGTARPGVKQETEAAPAARGSQGPTLTFYFFKKPRQLLTGLHRGLCAVSATGEIRQGLPLQAQHSLLWIHTQTRVLRGLSLRQ